MGLVYYPPADHSTQAFTPTGAFVVPPRIVVLHTTETTGWPGYDGGGVAPHFTVMGDFDRKRLVWRQHFPLNRHARALRNPAGGVETNRYGAIQVEIVGTCDRSYNANRMPHLRSWDLPAWAVDGLAEFIAWCHVEYGIPYAYPSVWAPFSRTMPDTARMSYSKWRDFKGVCGHQHVPENTHGDPGDLPIEDIIRRARERTEPMALTGDDKEWIGNQLANIAPRVWQGSKADVIRLLNPPDPDNPTWTPESVIRQILDDVQELRSALVALTDLVARLTETPKSGRKSS